MSNYGYKKKKSVPAIFEPPCTYISEKEVFLSREVQKRQNVDTIG
jgi:hypothetical protein